MSDKEKIRLLAGLLVEVIEHLTDGGKRITGHQRLSWLDRLGRIMG